MRSAVNSGEAEVSTIIFINSHMRSEPYHDDLHTFRGDTKQRRHRRNGGSSYAMDERRCRHDMMITRLLLQHINTSYMTKGKVQQPAVFYAEKRINECCHSDGMQVAYVSNVTRPRFSIVRLGMNKC